MLFRKIAAMTAAVLLVAALPALPAMAHGHHGHHGGHHGNAQYYIDTTPADSNTTAGNATDNTVITESTADVPTYSNTGYPVCTVEGCPETGLHCHDDFYYCGYQHSGGYCDGSCVAVPSCSGHYGRHGTCQYSKWYGHHYYR